ncbi:hypothetical protein EOA60_04580 [Mesorhizobium sp. M1A.F.Ca.IN.020.06.1.1]|uniref:hypothetical protein n=1 Tax=unclassified Mesorhizobium TaxID=325217 RepID=UPI000FC9CBDA|nr:MULTISPECIES: hypothetical protein [unclassified Mesorhizobium]RUV84328.1 hypothetical protein EOA51_22160 [Mesorhizobium sp. M1A.F.Ca.IN.020.32.1.1]RUW13865.1 hypothetical protein EOA46_05220 [Mesorhizobium sp. M1A.F.Ca.IN.022.05.2.1]RUW35440.1 hypothetical protein EOA60_04580 [Mesorhizobium sp. M1A.F.Ca.IN.020.06.1.1]RWF81328.1 MAG: hypothetical protein EOQ35_14305 [Mesorhizobium sp.]RWG06178.1 MAG: hypothetical protein EOQ38_02055 [Mesorhizobium sp.]
MSRSAALRQHLTDLKGWIEHWQTDRLCNLVPTESSLILAKSHADSALTLLDRMEAEKKEAA